MASQQSSTKRTSKKTSSTRTTNRNNTSAKRPVGRPKGSTKRPTSKATKRGKTRSPFADEIILICTVVVSLLLILSNFNLGGKLSDYVNYVTFGFMGFLAYLFPFILFFTVAFGISNQGNKIARRKIICTVLFLVVLAGVFQLISYPELKITNIWKDFTICAENKTGGGLIGSLLSSILVSLVNEIGAYIILVALLAILFMFITEKLIFSSLNKRSYEKLSRMREEHRLQREEYDEEYEEGYEEEYQYEQPRRKAKIYTFDREETGEEKISLISRKKKKEEKKVEENKNASIQELFHKPGMKEIKPIVDIPIQRAEPSMASAEVPFNPEDTIYRKELNGKFNSSDVEQMENEVTFVVEQSEKGSIIEDDIINKEPSDTLLYHQTEEFMDDVVPSVDTRGSKKSGTPVNGEEKTNLDSTTVEPLVIPEEEPIKQYEFPPIRLLSKPKGTGKGMTDYELKETAMKLQSTLESFGVRVTITNVSCGPAVTRYELQPEQGVKVSRITKLADDIKLNLAAADIRIEAPIPGKAAVGVEVPNKVNTMVSLRELLESNEFKEHKSDVAFAVGKDIGGATVVTDIAKMPHLLIAGATGSGKSVCINTLIMSILYKANPEDVKLIMIDPKVVELSIYNGIPHLLIPVVTDPKKASSALNWAVAEMTERYKKFADLGVRDIKGYNQKIKSIDKNQDVNYQPMPQIVIIVDELADLMMVAPGEVEDAICRLAQMARAAGLHLIIATQRPSVNVITGLIKANVPSRIAFSVSSAIDSRTILDGGGAEKLLGKGDMLFFPSGYPKPVRVQGAFVSDKEVSQVVEFLANQNTKSSQENELEGKITSAVSAGASASKGSEFDEYFVDAGKFIIEKDKASIGMLQRMFKIGFNRAARIMDQLYDAGVVGADEGTKPRKVLMSIEEFEQYIDEYV